MEQDINYRLDLNKDELDQLKVIVSKIAITENVNVTLLSKIENPKLIKKSDKKVAATKNATIARSAKTKLKIENAINLLRMENKEITYYSIHKVGNVAFKTVQKYINDQDLKSLNNNNY